MSIDEVTKKYRRGCLYPYGARCRVESHFGMVQGLIYSQPVVSAETWEYKNFATSRFEHFSNATETKLAETDSKPQAIEGNSANR